MQFEIVWNGDEVMIYMKVLPQHSSGGTKGNPR